MNGATKCRLPSRRIQKEVPSFVERGPLILIKKFQVLENKPNFQCAKIKHEKRIGFGLAIKVLQSMECLKITENKRGVSGVSSSHTISDIFNGAQELNNEEGLNAGSFKEIVNSEAVGTYTCRTTIVDFLEESWYYQSCGNKRCYKDVPKGSKVGDYCKKCNGPIGSIIIRYLMKVLSGDSSSGTPDIMSTMLDRECLFKVEVTVRFGNLVYAVKNITEDAEMMAQFSSISYAEGEVSTSKKCGTSVDDNTAQEDHVTVTKETSSSSTISEITLQKHRRDSDLSHVDEDGGVLTFSSIRVLKK
ncbi:hypothetical protein OROMI_027303 [Orobanche minor]